MPVISKYDHASQLTASVVSFVFDGAQDELPPLVQKVDLLCMSQVAEWENCAKTQRFTTEVAWYTNGKELQADPEFEAHFRASLQRNLPTGPKEFIITHCRIDCNLRNPPLQLYVAHGLTLITWAGFSRYAQYTSSFYEDAAGVTYRAGVKETVFTEWQIDSADK